MKVKKETSEGMLLVWMCVCVCMWERERERGREIQS